MLTFHAFRCADQFPTFTACDYTACITFVVNRALAAIQELTPVKLRARDLHRHARLRRRTKGVHFVATSCIVVRHVTLVIVVRHISAHTARVDLRIELIVVVVVAHGRVAPVLVRIIWNVEFPIFPIISTRAPAAMATTAADPAAVAVELFSLPKVWVDGQSQGVKFVYIASPAGFTFSQHPVTVFIIAVASTILRIIIVVHIEDIVNVAPSLVPRTMVFPVAHSTVDEKCKKKNF